VTRSDLGSVPEGAARIQTRRRHVLGWFASAVGLIGVALIVLVAASQRDAAEPSVAASATDASDRSRHARPPTETTRSLVSVGPLLPTSKPVTLDIPSIDVHSSLLSLGLAADGSIEVPHGARYDRAAWYRYSPTPGALGPAILLGHVDSAADGPSVFFRLGELGRGDRVSVVRADGSVATFAVDEVHRYSKDRFPTHLVYGDIDHAGLRLITCGGPFDETTGHYLDNVVVFASLVEAR
jgi:hypothetical protein